MLKLTRGKPMNISNLAGNSKLRTIAMCLGILACVTGMIYGLSKFQQETGQESEYRRVADEMRLLSQQIRESALRSKDGRESTFADLAAQVAAFEDQLSLIQDAEFYSELSLVEVSWQPVKRAAQTLIDAGPRIVFVRGLAGELAKNIRPMQQELSEVVNILRARQSNPETLVAAQSTLWLSERMVRNIDRILAGGSDSQVAADEFRTDAAEFIQIIEALTRGDTLVGIQKMTDANAMESMSSAFRLFSIVSTSVDRIAGSAAELRQAVAARDAILTADAELDNAVTALNPAIDRLAMGRIGDRATMMTLFIAPGVLAVGLMLVLYIGQRRRVKYTERGVAQISDALLKIAGGDLTVRVPEDNSVTRDIAREINASTEHQRELIRNVCTPFELSVDEINKIGVSARGQVEKGKELTNSVVESTTAATEMVRTSEEIKTSTAEAAKTAERNCQQVAQGYELTKDMSKASVDVRESVQETSKSAKRQSELIQSVTAAAEYIQALNTKISVVAINTRIEAEKAGEYGRPFLGIAEAIADLLREAGEEGRKIISEVRMLQNMSAENLASMENTVGTVVTILEYIENLDGSLEEINSGSAAISAIIRSVDDAAGQSAVSALHMNNSMAQIRERNVEISKFSEATQKGVIKLQRTMRDASESLGQFRIDEHAVVPVERISELDELENIPASTRIYREEDMSALEAADRARASV
jgi:twitching motility protein PilJ